MVLIDALFIADKGGGPALLDYLIEEIIKSGLAKNYFFLLDERYALSRKPNILQSISVKGSVVQRLQFYKGRKNEFARVLCFANVPPPVKLRVPVYTYFHNIRFLESAHKPFTKDNFSFFIKFLFIKYFSKNTNYFIVQSAHTQKELVRSKLCASKNCLKIPFFREKNFLEEGSKSVNHFAFVSTPSPHKNHERLLDAWELLYSLDLKPFLHLTVEGSTGDIVNKIDDLSSRGVNIINHGYTDPQNIYAQCAIAIYPSLSESFGLGLIEAAKNGLKIIASDLPYVTSVIRPSMTFDPYSVSSIADAVKIALEKEIPAPQLLVKNEIMKLLNLLAK